jgi:hypothetical protein
MKFKRTRQLNIKEVEVHNYDAIIVASGYESRATYLIEKLNPQSNIKYAIGFISHKDVLNRDNNDFFFKKKSFIIFDSDGNNADVIIGLLNDIVSKFKNRSLNLLIDYSCMTRVWYAAILQYFWHKQLELESVNISFSYTPSTFLPPPDEFILNHFVEPLDGFCNISIPDKPTALIIGLGYIPTRAFGLTEYFDAVPFLFFNDTSFNNKFSDAVEHINKELLDAVKRENVFKYPIRDMLYTESVLINLCKDLKDRFRIILAPCGPKPFTLISLITSLRLSEIDVWRISAGTHDIPIDKEHDGVCLIFNVHFDR